LALDDDYLEDLKDELIYAKRLAVDEDGKVLVWTGEAASAPEPVSESTPSTHQPHPEKDPPPIETARAESRSREAERRQLTLMFCDLVESTALSGQLDPEDLREVIRAYQQTSAEVIQRFDGHIAQYLGDGLLVYFGFPRAHEDDAERAVRAGLGILDAIGALNSQLESDESIRLGVRVGIHTGLVVVGEMGGGEAHGNLALGETPNVAARVQGLAPPNTVVISGATARLVEGTFLLADWGAHHLKGVAEPMTARRVLGLVDEPVGMEDASAERCIPLMGRDEEVGLVLRRWEQSQEGMGQVVLISGEPGVGKTALVKTLRAHVAREGYTSIVYRCSPYHTNSALYPMMKHLEWLWQWERFDTPAVKLDKMEQVLEKTSLSLAEIVPLFAGLFAVPVPEGRYPALNLTSQQQKKQTLEALVAWLLEEAERQPVLAVWENLHWADPSTLEMLGLVIEEAPTVPMLNVLTFRPDFALPWPARSQMTPLTLSRLERPQVEAMIERLAGGNALPTEVVEHIVAKTDGVPLFVEELTKMLLESDLLRKEANHYALTGPLSAVAIPATLQDSLMARLDQLGTAKEVAQLGAILGREFTDEMLQRVSQQEEKTLQAGLTRLVDADLLYRRTRPPRAKYMFKHSLIQDAAYASLLKSTRQEVHQQVARMLEEESPETVETQPELVAHHYTEAGCPEHAVGYWQQAGEHAVRRSAHAEAINHLNKGLELLTKLPETPERAQQEVALRLALGVALLATKGYGAAEVEQTYARARELCRQVGETSQLFRARAGLYMFYFVRAEYQTTRKLAEELFRQAQSAGDPASLLWAHSALGMTLYYQGEFAPAHEHLARGADMYDPQKHRTLSSLYGGTDPGTTCLSYDALALWRLGYPDRAQATSDEMLALARQLGHPLTLARAWLLGAVLSQFRREASKVLERAQATITLSEEQGFPQYLAMGRVFRGWALAEQGRQDEGIREMRDGLEMWRTVGGALGVSYYLTLLAEALGKVDRVGEGMRVLVEASVLSEQKGERANEAEFYRVKGELYLLELIPDEQRAETCFQQALAVARRQQAKAWELRAAMSLSRLWQRRGRRDEARQLLKETYEWFSEGHDTEDLRESRELLEELELQCVHSPQSVVMPSQIKQSRIDDITRRSEIEPYSSKYCSEKIPIH
jgi:predicted ATPase/class 3 adenylate cyclase